MKQTYHIIGGGIGGLCMALACQTQNISFTLYERQSEISYRNVGLGISRNIFPLLKDWSIFEETAQLGSEIRNFHFVDKQLKYLRSLRMKAPALAVIRPKFHQLLYQSLSPASIKLNSPKALHEFTDNQVIIVADGAQSAIRKMLYPQIELRVSQQLIWRGIAKLKLPARFHHAYHDFIGGNLRFAIIHSGGDLYSWYAIEISSKLPDKNTDAKTHLQERIRHYHPLLGEIITATENIYPELLQDIPPQNRKGLTWYLNNLVFIGDAIHPTTPNMANGACLAMEDAYVLAKLLKQYRSDPPSAFPIFQALRAKKVDAVVRQSWMLGRLMHQKNPMIDKMMQWATRLVPQWAFDRIYAQVLDDESTRMVR